jgi:hypothetical protein
VEGPQDVVEVALKRWARLWTLEKGGHAGVEANQREIR